MAETAIFTGSARELVFQLARVEDDKTYDVIEHKEKRSLSQNSYYWVLLGKVADKLRISKTHLHNDMLRNYGQRMMIDDKCAYLPVPDTEEAEMQVNENDKVHLKPTSSITVGKDGVTYRYYVMLRGSHDYNTREMSVLLDGLIQEARQLDIEVLPPDELARMRMLEQQAEDRRNGKTQTN